MIMKTYSVIVVLLSLFVTSCITYNEIEPVIDRFIFKNNKDTPLENIPYKAARIVVLETRDECLLSDVLEVRPYLSYLYVLDSGGMLYVFDLEGKYINSVGRRGEGPDEYLKLSAFFINKKDRCISIIDDVKNKIYSYDLTGNYLHTVSVSPSVKYSDNSIMTKEGDILLNYFINFGDNAAYSIMDGNDYDKNVYLKSYAPIEVKGYLYNFSTHPMSENTEGDIHFIMPLCDTVFVYSDKGYCPKYTVDIPGKMVERELFKTNTTEKGKTYSSLLFKYGNDGFFTGFIGIFETDKHILLKYKYNGVVSGFYLGNKENFEGNYYLCSIPKDPVKIPIINIVGSSDHEFIGTFTTTDLITFYNNMEKNNIGDTFRELEKIVENLEEESNPSLVFYVFE